MIDTYTSPLTDAAPLSWVSRLWVAVLSAVILLDDDIEPVLSRASATRSLASPHTVVDERPIGTSLVPMMPMKSVGMLAVAETVTDGPVGA